MKPLCICLDVSRDEKHIYFGFLLSSITIRLQKYDELSKKNHFVHSDSLVILIKTRVEKCVKIVLTDFIFINSNLLFLALSFFKLSGDINDDKIDKQLLALSLIK